MIIHWKTIKSCALATTSVAAIGLALAGLGGGQAHAQEEGAEAPERIVVTGSRIVRRDFQANSPIVTIEADAFRNRSSLNVESALNQLPQFVPSGTTDTLANAAGTAFPAANSAPGAATLNLRGLGANRGLVLVNGRRPQPVNSQLLIDVNSIPAAAIENVEVITGGAAAVYGADAIAGVVNFRLRQNFEGFELDSQYGMTERGDGETAQVSGLIGGNFASGRGNAMVGVVWSQQSAAYERNSEFVTRGWQDPLTNPGGLGSSDLIRFRATTTGQFLGVNADGSLFNPALALTDPAGPVGAFNGPLNAGPGGSGFKVGRGASGPGTGALGFNRSDGVLNIPSTRYSIFGNGRYDVTDSIQAFIEVTATQTTASAQSLTPEAFDTWSMIAPYSSANDDPDSPTFGDVPSTWHPVTRAMADVLNTAGLGGTPVTSYTLNMGLPWLTERMMNETTNNIFQITPGLTGDLPIKDWTFEVYGSHGETNVVSQFPSRGGPIDQQNLQQLINGRGARQFANDPITAAPITSTGPWGAGWNAGPFSILGAPRTCESGIALFDENGNPNYPIEVTPDCADYAVLELNSVTEIEQNIVEGSIQGGVFDLPAGELRFALGGTYREVGYSFTPDTGYSGQQERSNAVGLVLLPQATAGSFDVREVYGELLVPILSGLPLIDQLNLELGYRLSDYSTSGEVDTHKILGDWSVTDWVRLRGGYQLANRAPNVYELFAPASSGFSLNFDPCTNVANYTPPWGNVAANPNRANVQLACAELIARDGGYNYTTILTNPNPGEPQANFPALDQTHMSNFRWLLFGYGSTLVPFNIALQQGNPDLESETAETWTGGVVVTSPFDHPLLSGLNASVDWYQIEIAGTINFPSATTVYSQCLDPRFNPLIGAAPGANSGAEILAGNPYCALINREPIDAGGVFAVPGSGRDRTYEAKYVNLGGTETSGIDVQVNYSADFEDLGPLNAIPGGFNASVLATFLKEYAESPFPGADFVDYTGTSFGSGYYDFSVLTTLGYTVGPGSAGLRIRYLPEIDPAPGATTFPVTSHTNVDLFGRFQLNDVVELRGGIDNLFNEDPEVTGRAASNNALSTTSGYYDQLGRRFFVGATLRY